MTNHDISLNLVQFIYADNKRQKLDLHGHFLK